MARLVPEINSEKMSSRRRGRPPKLGVELRERLEETIKAYIDATKGKMTVPDAVLAKKFSKESGVAISADTVRNFRIQLGIPAFPRGGPRPGAGRPRGSTKGNENDHDVLLVIQLNDCRVNSFEVGIGRKSLDDEDWFNFARGAFDYRDGIYVRDEKFSQQKDVPAKLPRNPFVRSNIFNSQAFEAIKGQ